jgi:hypothetical protein
MKVTFRTMPLLVLVMMLLPITSQAQAKEEASAPTITLDKTTLDNGGEITVSGQVPAGAQVYIEVYSADKTVRANRFDSKKDPKTGKIPYKFYLTHEMPAFYTIIVPTDMAPELDKAKTAGSDWKYSEVLKKTGADAAYSAPAKIKIDSYQATIMASIIGSRGDLLPPMDEKAIKSESMKLVKGRFRNVGKLLAAGVETTLDGVYSATIKMPTGQAPGKYSVTVTAVTERIKEGDKETVKKVKSAVATFNNTVSFPTVYLNSAGTSVNLIGPFLLCLIISIFGVLMGAGGGFILNPILVSLFPLPHTIVAGTVMPTVLFSQGSGIYNYSKIKFINWKLGIGVGCAMLVGGFIGPKLTEMITLDQFKFAFGWILMVLAGLMYWQTTAGYLEKNKKEQAILKEFKKRAEECAKRGEASTAACPTDQK